ncbi:hypothetical protein L6R50_01085 [Myxococcota bacterium]|nr:hypothetical protein [Myxococcota bacterium]
MTAHARAHPSPATARRLPPWALPAGLGALALAWRLVLSRVYAGWEEGDFGYLAITRGVLQSRFTFWEMDETPLYFVLSAAVMGAVGDARLATMVVSLAAGTAAVVLGFLLARRVYGTGVALAAGLALCFQPELSLYSTTAMREPLYAALVLGAWLLLVDERFVRSALLLAASLLVRFDTLAANVPVAVWHAFRSRRRIRPAATLIAVVALAALAWSVTCRVQHGTFAFWGGAVGKNLASAEGAELGLVERLRLGLAVDLALLLRVLPARVGWPLLGGAAWLGIAAARGRVRGAEAALALATWSNVGIWLGLGFVSRYDPGHNLYWKWALLPAALVCLTGARGLEMALRDLPWRAPRVRTAALAAAVVLTAAPFGLETRAQVQRSRETIAPLVDVGRWIEAEVPEETPMVLDGIPRMWLERRSNARPMTSWIEVAPGRLGPEELGAVLARRRVAYVLWYAESWTHAPVVAPYLSAAAPHPAGEVVLTPIREDSRAGFILYRVDPS